MNRADERLRAAARTAADKFPTGGDLPPLRLPEMAHGRQHQISAAGRGPVDRRRRVRAWITPLAAAAAVIAVISGLVVPHLAGSKADQHEHATHNTAAALAALRHEQRQLDALVVAWAAPATGLQFDRGNKMVWLMHGGYLRATARCMAGLGYHISAKQLPYNLGDFADNTQMPDLPRIAATHSFVGGIGGVISPAYSKKEQRALNTHCLPQQLYEPLLRTYSPVSNAWWRMITRAQASSKARAAIPALQACATRYGFPNDPYGNASGPIRSVGDFMGWVAGFLDGAGSRGASNGTLRSLERHWTSVFITCAKPVVGIYQRMLLQAQPGFLHQHAQQIMRLDRLAWRYFGQRHS